MENFTYKVLKIALRLLTLIPLRAGYAFARVICFLLADVVRYRKNVIKANLRLVFPDKSESEITAITRRYYKHLSEIFIEIVYALYLPEKELRKRVTFVNIDAVNRYHSEGRHIIGVAAHYLNWEWGYTFPRYGSHTLMEVYKHLQNSIADRLFRDIRSRFGGIPVEMSNLRQIVVEARKNPLLVYIVADQSPAGVDKWYYTDFLGVSGTPVFTGPEKLARKFDAVFMYVNMRKIRRGYYSIEFIPLCDNLAQMAVNEPTDRYLRTLEQIIADKPEYWMWSHRRWKRRKPENDA
jgi:KDO2-lipid IV(A) lauroyltransferase